MTLKEYKEILQKDRMRYSNKNHFKVYFCNHSYKINTHLRRVQYFRSNKFLYLLYQFERWLYNKKCVKYGCDIPSHITVGSGFKIDHPCGIVINSQAIIGENFNIKSGSVIGKTPKGVPVIGDNVSLGVHSLLIGGIKIGNNVDIGAGAIVTTDVPDNGVMICDKAHLLKMKSRPM